MHSNLSFRTVLHQQPFLPPPIQQALFDVFLKTEGLLSLFLQFICCLHYQQSVPASSDGAIAGFRNAATSKKKRKCGFNSAKERCHTKRKTGEVMNRGVVAAGERGEKYSTVR